MNAKMKWARQGDIYFLKLSRLPKGAELTPAPNNGRLVVAVGETTGHEHVVDVQDARVYDFMGLPVLVSDQPIPTTHPDHGTDTLAPGKWIVAHQRVYLGAPQRSQD